MLLSAASVANGGYSGSTAVSSAACASAVAGTAASAWARAGMLLVLIVQIELMLLPVVFMCFFRY